jgi:hypothetical protein
MSLCATLRKISLRWQGRRSSRTVSGHVAYRCASRPRHRVRADIAQSCKRNMNPDSKWSLRRSYRDARRRVKDVLKPPSHTQTSQLLPTPDITSPSSANSPPSSNPPPPATNVFQTTNDGRSAPWAALGTALRALKESLNVFPPLKAAVSELLECLDTLQVRTWGSTISWRA